MFLPAGLFTFSFVFLSALAAEATDVAFWKPYTADDSTYLLAHFETPTFSDTDGTARTVEVVEPAPAQSKEGRFGSALRCNGEGGLRCRIGKRYTEHCIALEAWIRLDA
jgi:hypothetical protein